jgi:hypothetical protein
MKPIIPLIVLLFFLSLSCEKDNNNKNETPVCDSLEMLVNSLDTIISGPYVTELVLDIDGDSIDDIRFWCGYVPGLPSGGAYRYSEIMCLSKNTLILGYYTTDTIFLNRQTYVDSLESEFIKITEYYNSTCHRKDIKDTIQQINYDSFKILPKDKVSDIRNSDTFKADTIQLLKSRVTRSYIYNNNDSIIYYTYIDYNDCYSFPRDEIKYIGLKLIKDKGERIGWIKICILDIDKLLVLESAIQK